MSSLKSLTDILTPAQIAAFEMRASRIEGAFRTNPVLCERCGVRFLNYHAAAAETRLFEPLKLAGCSRGTDRSKCIAIARLREVLDGEPALACAP